MLITFMITDEWRDDGRRRYAKANKSNDRKRYLLENVNLPAVPMIGSQVCFLRDDAKGAYFRVTQVIYYPHQTSPLTLARSNDLGMMAQVFLDATGNQEQQDNIYHVCLPDNEFTPGGGVWEMLPSIEEELAELAELERKKKAA